MSQPFPVVVLLGLAIFGFFLIAGSQFDFGPSPEDPDEITVFDEDIGQVGESAQDHRIESFGDVSVGQRRGDIPVYVKDEEEIYDRLVGGHKISHDFNATEPEGGSITFTVQGREGDGKVVTKVNGERIFEEHMIASEQEIEIEEQYLQSGENNIEIKAKRDGFLGLFSTVRYNLEDINMYVNDRQYHDFESNFQVHSYELEDFVSGELTFEVPQGTSVRNSPLEIRVNDNQVFSENVTRGDYEVDVNPQNADLNRGFNTIHFSTGEESEYELRNTELTLNYVGTGLSDTVEREFSLDEDQLSYVQSEDTTEIIRFDFSTTMPSKPEIEVELNDFETEMRPDQGTNEIDVSEELQEDNTLRISSSGSFTIQNLKVLSRMEEN